MNKTTCAVTAAVMMFLGIASGCKNTPRAEPGPPVVEETEDTKFGVKPFQDALGYKR